MYIKKKNHKKNKGFVSIELMLGLSIISLIVTQGLMLVDNNNKTRLARNVGEHIRKVGEATNSYISEFQNEIGEIAALSSNAALMEGKKEEIRTKLLKRKYGDAKAKEIFQGLNCNTNNYCTLTIEELKNAKYLPLGYEQNPYQSGYDIQLKVTYLSETAKKYPIIEGVVLTNQSWMNGNQVNYALLGEATHQAGIDAGYTGVVNGVPNPNLIKGFKGGWSLTKQNYPIINKPGILAYRVGIHAGGILPYLRLDGTSTMEGDIDLGGNDLKFDRNKFPNTYINSDNAGNMKFYLNDGGGATPMLSIEPEEVIAEKWLCSQNEDQDKICIGGDTKDKNGGNFEIKMFDNRPLLIHNTVSNVDVPGKISGSNSNENVVLRIGGSTAITDNALIGGNLFIGEDNAANARNNLANNDRKSDGLSTTKLSELSGKNDGLLVSNYNVTHGLAILRGDKTIADLNNYSGDKKYIETKDEQNPVAIELGKDGRIIANGLFIRNVGNASNNSGDSRLKGGLDITQIIPSYSSRGAYVVYDEDYIKKPECKWNQDKPENKDGVTYNLNDGNIYRQGIPKIILSWGNIHTSGDEVDLSSSAAGASSANTDITKVLRKHRVILKAEDVKGDYWRAIVKTRSFDGKNWVSAGQAIAQIYCQYY